MHTAEKTFLDLCFVTFCNVRVFCTGPYFTGTDEVPEEAFSGSFIHFRDVSFRNVPYCIYDVVSFVTGLYGPNDAVVSLDNQSFLPTVTGKGLDGYQSSFSIPKNKTKNEINQIINRWMADTIDYLTI